jgi:hypothetical protein
MRTKTFIPQSRIQRTAMRVFALINILTITLFASGCREKPLTAQDAQQLRAQMDSAIRNKDVTVFSNLLDAEELGDRVIAQMPGKTDLSTKSGIRKSASGFSLGNQLMLEIRKGADYSFVRAYSENGVQHLIYRLYGDGGLNYHDWELIRKGGKPKAADVLIYYTGETFSQTMAGLHSGMNKDDISEARR